MGSQYVDGGPDWGSISSGLANEFLGAPQKSLGNMAAADAIAQKRALWAEQVKSRAAYQAAVDQLYKNAPPLVTPDGPPIPFQGPVVPGDPATALPPPKQSYRPDEAGMAQRESDYQLARQAGGTTVLVDPSKWPQQRGYAGVATRGPATNAYDKTQDIVFLTGNYPSAEQASAHNYTVHNENGPTGRSVMSFDGKTIAGTNQPLTSILNGPNERLLATGPAETAAANPLKDEASAQKAFYDLADKMLTRPKEFSDADLTRALQYRDRGWGRETKTTTDPSTNRPLEYDAFKTPLPTEGPAAKLMEALTKLGGGVVPAETPPPPPAVSPFVTGAAPIVAVGPGNATVDALAAVPPPAAAAAAAAPPPPPTPIVPPAAAPGARTMRPLTPGDAAKVAKEYTDHPLVKSLDQARSGYSSMLSAMPNDDAAADLAIFIGAAKVLDPPSVVRDQEGQRIAGSASPIDQFFGKLNRLQGGSGLTRETRLQIWNMVNEKLKQDIGNVSRLRENTAVRIVEAGHPDPNKWLDPLPEVVPLDRTLVNKQKINADAPEGESLFYPSPRRYGAPSTGAEQAPIVPPPPPAVRPGERWR